VGAINVEQNLWDEALQTLKEEDLTRYGPLVAGNARHGFILMDILRAIEIKKRNELCTA